MVRTHGDLVRSISSRSFGVTRSYIKESVSPTQSMVTDIPEADSTWVKLGQQAISERTRRTRGTTMLC
jgi:hypothetical protein